jgi:membrane protein YqaA with SNARE-associated domain
MSLEAEIATTLTSGIASLQPILDRYGLWALFVACLVEGFGIPLPGQTLLIACALLAAAGKLDLTAVLLVAWTATQLGDIIGYLIGRYGLQGVLKRAANHRERLAKVEQAFARWGIGLLLVARFLDGLRQTSNIAAGALADALVAFSRRHHPRHQSLGRNLRLRGLRLAARLSPHHRSPRSAATLCADLDDAVDRHADLVHYQSAADPALTSSYPTGSADAKTGLSRRQHRQLMSSIIEARGGRSDAPSLRELPTDELAPATNLILLVIDGLGADWLAERSPDGIS